MRSVVALTASLFILAGCAVVEPVGPRYGAVWVPAHVGAHGFWVPGHWRG